MPLARSTRSVMSTVEFFRRLFIAPHAVRVEVDGA
jgi:hypothetical protein